MRKRPATTVRALSVSAEMGKRPWATPAASRASIAKRASLMSATPGTGGQDAPCKHPPTQVLGQTHQDEGFEHRETQ